MDMQVDRGRLDVEKIQQDIDKTRLDIDKTRADMALDIERLKTQNRPWWQR